MPGKKEKRPTKMGKEPVTCVLESKGIGKVCVDKDGFTISLTDETMSSIKDRINVMRGLSGEKEERVLATSLKLLDEGAYVTALPASGVTGIGVFPYKDSKDEVIFGMSVTSKLATDAGMERPVALIRMKRSDAVMMEKATPRNIARVADIGSLVKEK